VIKQHEKEADRIFRNAVGQLFHDPAIESLRVEDGAAYKRSPLTARILASADCVVIVTDHSSYDYEWVLRYARRVLDTRNATRGVKTHAERIARL